jgi:hypothetical protein
LTCDQIADMSSCLSLLCAWNPAYTCGGTPRPCDQLDRAACPSVPGCRRP